MSWIKQNTTLTGQTVELIPLHENHFEELELVARDERIWEHLSPDMSTTQKRLAAFAHAVVEREKESQFPFVIFHKKEKKIIGSTRLMEIYPAHKKLEIGWTFLHPDYWATEVNLECKLLLLTFCFEELNANRVQLKTNEKNMRSRKAIQKIGATLEGILRKDIIRDNGAIRNTAYFSIVDEEWGEAKENLTALYKTKAAKNAT